MNTPTPPKMAPHELRVIDEAAELQTRITKLRLFIRSSPDYAMLCTADKYLLKKQLEPMQDYLTILLNRINLIYRAAFKRDQELGLSGTDLQLSEGLFTIDSVEKKYREWKQSVTPQGELEPLTEI